MTKKKMQRKNKKLDLLWLCFGWFLFSSFLLFLTCSSHLCSLKTSPWWSIWISLSLPDILFSSRCEWKSFILNKFEFSRVRKSTKSFETPICWFCKERLQKSDEMVHQTYPTTLLLIFCWMKSDENFVLEQTFIRPHLTWFFNFFWKFCFFVHTQTDPTFYPTL